jgi:hypothetical protein
MNGHVARQSRNQSWFRRDGRKEAQKIAVAFGGGRARAYRRDRVSAVTSEIFVHLADVAFGSVCG